VEGAVKIIRYKLFHDSESFEAWQYATEVTICGITPMLSGLEIAALSESGATSTSKISAFVTYHQWEETV
jgi:hypothetical protein